MHCAKQHIISPIEKFNYLRTKLIDEASQAKAGFVLYNENYDLAVTILKERFGYPHEAKDLHHRRLIHV